MRKLILLSTLLIGLLCNAQNQQWLNYTNKKHVKCSEIEGSKVWIGTSGGIVLRDTSGAIIAEYTKTDGLADNHVNALAIDVQGNKWFGTDRGVSKFDGTTWTTYNISNSALVANGINSITIDAQGNKWFGTTGGVSKFDGTNWITYTMANSGLAHNIVNCIAIDSQGNKWFGTYFSGVSKFDGSTWTTYNISNSGLAKDNVRCMVIDAQGTKWFGTGGGGVSKFDGTTWTTYKASNSGLGFSDDDVFSMTIDAQGNKWFGGVYVSKFDGTNWITYTNVNVGFTSGLVLSINIDAQGNKWFGTRDAGVFKFDGNTWTKPAGYISGLLDNSCLSMAIDAQGNKWFGIYGSGVSKFDGNNWITYDTSNSGLPRNDVRFIFIDTQGNKWIGADAGVSMFDGSVWVTYNKSNSGLAYDLVESGAEDAHGNKWFGTPAGVSKFDGSNWVTFSSSNSGLVSNEVLCITIDKTQGDAWFGTGAGISKFDGSAWTNYNVPGNRINSIAIDAQGNKWFATNYGVSKFDGSVWTNYTQYNSGLAYNTVDYIAIDGGNNKWFGTASGISRFDGNTWTTYNKSNSGLGSSGARYICIDAQGNKWFGSNGEGVSVLLDSDVVAGKHRLIRGKIFHDKNANQQKDSIEPFLNGQKVRLMPYSVYTYTDNNGEYIFAADTGKVYTLSYTPQNFWTETTSDPSSFVLHDSDITLTDIGVNAPDTSIIATNLATLTNRCHTEVPFWFTYTNKGTVNDSGQIVLTIDKNVKVYSSFPPYDSLSVSNKAYYRFGTLLPGATRQIKLSLQIPQGIPLGVFMVYASKIIFGNKIVNDTLRQIFTCSFDPNIKTVNPVGYTASNYTLKKEELNYTIHFQNTGNDTAYNITVKDTLSSYLDWNSFKVTGSSHTVNTTINTNGALNFSFYNINLVDSIHNEKLSHGYVSYKIKCKPNVADFSIVRNRAYIYFDSNPAVITNTTISNMVTVFPSPTLMPENKGPVDELKIIPHPLSSESVLDFSNPEKQKIELRVYDITGRQVYITETTGARIVLNRSRFHASGLYMYQLYYGDGSLKQGKLMVK